MNSRIDSSEEQIGVNTHPRHVHDLHGSAEVDRVETAESQTNAATSQRAGPLEHTPRLHHIIRSVQRIHGTTLLKMLVEQAIPHLLGAFEGQTTSPVANANDDLSVISANSDLDGPTVHVPGHGPLHCGTSSVAQQLLHDVEKVARCVAHPHAAANGLLHVNLAVVFLRLDSDCCFLQSA